jgi:hypothetical protein
MARACMQGDSIFLVIRHLTKERSNKERILTGTRLCLLCVCQSRSDMFNAIVTAFCVLKGIRKIEEKLIKLKGENKGA